MAKGSKLDGGSHASLVLLQSVIVSANTPAQQWVFCVAFNSAVGHVLTTENFVPQVRATPPVARKP